MIALMDQIGQQVNLNGPAQRVVSIVPSQTELLYYFGLESQTIGITKFCIHPKEWFETKQRVGGTKNLNLDEIRALKPDLIIANKEENTKEEIEALQKEFQVYTSDIYNVPDALGMIKDVGVLCGKEQMAVDLIDNIQEGFSEIKKTKGKVAYFIWKKPYMLVGQNNFIDSMIQNLGLTNAVEVDRYVEFTLNEVKLLKADYLFLSTEPFPFKESDKEELEKQLNTRVVIVDGEMFSWYGSRMLLMKDYFNQLIRTL